MKKEEICDICGHFWSPSMHSQDNCSICGIGSCIKINSELDVRKNKRSKVKRGQYEKWLVQTDISV